MRSICLFIFLLATLPSMAQVEEEPKVEKDSVPAVFDAKYREDQFYATISYNLMQSKPSGFSLNSLSLGMTIGFLRDMPVNEARTHSIAVGLGYSYNNLKNNLIISKDTDGTIRYEVDPDIDYTKNRQVLHYLELPIELRWRNSDAISHKFWRVYTGFKVSYLMKDRSQFESNGDRIRVTGNKDLNNLVYGAYVGAGWNTWNFYAYYGITPLYKDAKLNSGEDLKLNSLNLGLIFYIL